MIIICSIDSVVKGESDMTSTTAAINDLLGTLEEEDLKAAMSFIQFLSAERRKERKENSKSVLHEIQGLFSEIEAGILKKI